MLTREQEQTLADACEIFLQARKSEDKIVSLELFNKAFGMLIEHIDDVDDIYYRLVFANCIEQLQRKGNMEFNPVLIHAKTDIYIKTLSWFLDAPNYKTDFQGHFFMGFDALGRLFLLGEDGANQNDHYAYICYQCIRLLGIPMVEELYLKDFVEDVDSNTWKYVGVRPK